MFFRTVLVAVFALVCTAASAQRVVNGISTSDAKACWNYLVKNQKDTIASVVSTYKAGQDSIVVRRKVYLSDEKLMDRYDSLTYRLRVDTIWVVDKEKAAALYKESVNTQFAEKMFGDSDRDTYYTYFNGVKGVSEGDINAGKVVHRSVDKYGWGVNLYAGWQFAEHVNSPIVGAGLEYSRSWWAGILNAEAGHSKYTHNAINAGEKYWSFRTEAQAAFQPFRIDRCNQNRLFLFGGLGFEWYNTNSKPFLGEDGNEYQLQSWGNFMYPTAGIRFEHRAFATGNSFVVFIQWRLLSGVIQNDNLDRFNGIVVGGAVNLGVFRNKIGISKREVKALYKKY